MSQFIIALSRNYMYMDREEENFGDWATIRSRRIANAVQRIPITGSRREETNGTHGERKTSAKREEQRRHTGRTGTAMLSEEKERGTRKGEEREIKERSIVVLWFFYVPRVSFNPIGIKISTSVYLRLYINYYIPLCCQQIPAAQKMRWKLNMVYALACNSREE